LLELDGPLRGGATVRLELNDREPEEEE
jgi:hypothetical protein